AARLSITARVKQAYYRLAYTYAVGDVVTRNRDLLDTLMKVSENRYAVGQAAQQDVIKAQTQLSILELQLERVRQERATREGALPAMYELRFDVNVPLQRAKRAAAVAEQLSTVEQARSAYDSTRLGLQSRIQEDFQMASTSVRLATLYRDTVLPQARLALESSMASYQTGAVDFLSVLTNFGTVLEYEMTYFDELASYHTAVSRLEEMIGAPLVH